MTNLGGVRVNGALEPHTTLAPRQALLPTPYAIFAASAGSVASGTVTADQLNSGGVPPAAGQFLSYYEIDFGFRIDDRFVNVFSPSARVIGTLYGQGFGGPNPNKLWLTTDGSTDLTVFVY